jgi:hypothetical protein
MVDVHSNGTFRDGQASGTISDGTTNFTPSPSIAAQLQDTQGSQITVQVN